MEIPKTLKTTWDKVSSDGNISRADYEALIKAAAPTKKNSEFDEDEKKFLSSLKSDLEKNGGEKGNVPVDGLSFAQSTPPEVIKAKPIGEVPETLKATWNNAISDGKVTADEYKTLVDVASPNWDDGELDDKEKDFLSNLKALITESNGTFKIEKPAAPPEKVVQPASTETTNAASTEPAPAKETKPKTHTGKKPNQAATQPVADNTKPEKPVKAPVATNQTAVAPDTKTKPEVKPQTEEKPADGTETTTDAEPIDLGPAPELKTESDEDIQHLNKIKSILTKLGDDPDFEPLKGIVEKRITTNSFTKQFTTDLNKIMGTIVPGNKASLTQAKANLQTYFDKLPEGVKAMPDINNSFKYSMGVIESQITGRPVRTTKPANKPAADNSNVPETLKKTWNAAKADGKIDVGDYQKLIKAAAPNNKDEEIDQKEAAFLGDIKSKLEANNGIYSFVDAPDEPAVTTQTNKPAAQTEDETPDVASELGEVPETLKSTWDQISVKGKVTAEDYGNLIKAATPNNTDEELDEKEQKFLGALKGKLEQNDGTLDLKAKPAATTGDQPVTTASKPNKPVLLNWPGYTDETKSALSSAFGKSVVMSKDNMPILKPQAAKPILQAFGVSSITDLQKKVKAKPDGKFGPETFFKAKVFIANEMNKPGADQEKLNKMLSALGSDAEINGMKESLASPNKGVTSSKADDGVPDSLKDAWKNAISDGKVTADDYQKLMDAASPNKKDEEFDEGEVKFLGQVKKLLEENGGELTVQKPADESTEETKPEANADDGVPASLKATWSKITADGKITAKDYESLLKAATPNGKDEELEQDEVDFLGQVKKLLEDNGGELTVEKPGAKTETKPSASTASEDDGVPATLKATWSKVTADGKLTKADFDSLMKAASPNKKNSEFDDSELEFLGTLRDLFEKNKTDVLDVQKPAASTPTSKPQQTSTASKPSSKEDDGVPATLKSTWSKVTADGKLTKADFDLLMKAASPNKKNSEFDDSELEFLATIRDLFEKNKTDVLDVQKPETSAPTSKPQPKANEGIPETLKAAWNKITADGKITVDDYDVLLKAAAPGKKNTEFDNEEIKFLAAIKDKLNANNGTIVLKK